MTAAVAMTPSSSSPVPVVSNERPALIKASASAEGLSGRTIIRDAPRTRAVTTARASAWRYARAAR